MGQVLFDAEASPFIREGFFKEGMSVFFKCCAGGIDNFRRGVGKTKKELLPRLADGDMMFCLALIEPGLWYDLDNISTHQCS